VELAVAVNPEDVVKDACFVTSTNQVRKVIEITSDDRVNYLTRGASYKGESSWGYGPPRTALPLRSEFAGQVDRKVTCDWDPDYPERTA
jgi:hypothetical protein